MTVTASDPCLADAAARPGSARARLWSTVAWLVGDQVLQTLCTVVVGVIVARRLGPAGLGELSFALAVVALLTPLVVSHRQVLVRDLVDDPGAAPAVLGSGLGVGLVAAVVAWVGAVLFALTGATSTTVAVAIAVAAASLFGVAVSSAEAALQAEQQGRLLTVVRSGSSLTGAVLKVGAVAVGLGVVGFAAATAAQAAIAAMLCVLVLRRRVDGGPLWRFDRARTRRVARDSWPLAVSAAAIAVYMTVDQVMIGLIAGREEVGLYAAAVRISEATLLVPMVIVAAASPLLTRLHRTDGVAYRAQTQRVLNAFVAMGVVLAAVGLVVAGPLVRVLYGSAYAPSAPILAVLLVSNVFVFVGVASSPWIVNADLQRPYMVRTLCGAAINIGLNLLLLPRFGAIGAAWSTLVAYAYAGVVGTWIDPRSRPLARMIGRAFHPRAVAFALARDLPALVRDAVRMTAGRALAPVVGR